MKYNKLFISKDYITSDTKNLKEFRAYEIEEAGIDIDYDHKWQIFYTDLLGFNNLKTLARHLKIQEFLK